MGFCADASSKSCSNNLLAVSSAFNLSITPNANHAPTTTAATKPIKLRNGRPILVLSSIFIDMIDTHQNQNPILLMLLPYILCCKINQIHLLNQTLLYIVYIVFSYYSPNSQLTYLCHQDNFFGSSFNTKGLHVQLSQIQLSHLFEFK